MTGSFQHLEEIALRRKFDCALTEFAAAHDLDSQLVGDDDALAASHLAPGPHQRTPSQPVGRFLLR